MSARKVGPWTVHSERTVFENPWLRVRHHDVTHPDGSPGEYGVVHFKSRAIGILPVGEDGSVWLVGQHRFPHDAYSWELPEGGGDPRRPALEAAKAELAEETGFTAADWRQFTQFATSNSVTDEVAIGFLAWTLTPGPPSPDPSEALALRQVKFNDLLEMVMDGEISDSFTMIMTLKAHMLALRGAAPAPISQHLLAGRAPA